MTRARENARCVCGHVQGDHFPTQKCEHHFGCECRAFRLEGQADRLLRRAMLLFNNQPSDYLAPADSAKWQVYLDEWREAVAAHLRGPEPDRASVHGSGTGDV